MAKDEATAPAPNTPSRMTGFGALSPFRAVRAPAGIDPDAVSASFAKGVLTVTLPKPAEVSPGSRRIEVKPS